MADKLEYANMLGGKSEFHGILFTGVELVPLAQKLPSGQPNLSTPVTPVGSRLQQAVGTGR
jgi:hypothetical protein